MIVPSERQLEDDGHLHLVTGFIENAEVLSSVRDFEARLAI
jgi:hypothetical protein